MTFKEHLKENDGRESADRIRLELIGASFLTMPSGVPDDVYMMRISDTKLNSLKGGPTHVTGAVHISNNKRLTSLEGGPTTVGHGYFAYDNALTNLIGAPQYVNGVFSCHKNFLVTLEGAPRVVTKSFLASSNPLTHLEGIGHDFLRTVDGRLELPATITRCALGLFLVSCKSFALPFPGGHIIQLYLEKSHDLSERKKQMVECQHHLIDLGYEDLAEL